MARRELKAFLDRFEGEFAVLLIGEEGVEVPWPVDLLPCDAAEGAVVLVTLSTDTQANQAAGQAMDSLIERLERGE
ncbi:MAG: hypothetical protein A2Z18_10735 [Armatimonadetes bacterium RBG_16_58_9]|nr:MAG: hypothetical protein A2Z18_10735 [Armatimonadetes bacterium RBG_16_58_9]